MLWRYWALLWNFIFFNMASSVWADGILFGFLFLSWNSVFQLDFSSGRKVFNLPNNAKPCSLPAMLLSLRNIILPFVLTIQTAYSWTCYYRAQFLEYDDNYGLMIHGFIISVVILVAIYFLWYYKASWIAIHRLVFALWLMVGSPVTFVLAAIYYQNIFRTILATWPWNSF